MLNATKKEKIKKTERGNIHMDHEPCPLSNTKMLEVKLIAKLMDTCLRNNP